MILHGKKKNHNDPNGIIGLCPIHHKFADGGVYTKDVLREWKTKAPEKTKNPAANLDWFREKVAIKQGGTLYYDNNFDIVLKDRPMVWFNTNPSGFRLMNLDIPAPDGKPLIKMVNNDWEIFTKPTDLNCIPSGKQITITFPSGDFLDLRFKDINNAQEFRKLIPGVSDFILRSFQFPLCFIIIKLILPHLKIEFTNKATAKIGDIKIKGDVLVFSGNTVGLKI